MTLVSWPNFQPITAMWILPAESYYNDEDVEVFNFGKYKGKPVTEVLSKDPGYYGWMMNGDFPLYTKKVLTNIKLNSIKK